MALIKNPSEYSKEFAEFRRQKKAKKEARKAEITKVPAAPKKEKKKETRSEMVAKLKGPNYEEEYVHIDFELKPIHLERAIYSLVIISLIIMVIYNPVSDYVDFKKQVATGNISIVEYETADREGNFLSGAAAGTDAGAATDQETQANPDQENQGSGTENAKPLDEGDDSRTAEDNAPAEEIDKQTGPVSETGESQGTSEKDTADTEVIQIPGDISAENLQLTIEELVYEDKGSWAKITGVKVKLVNDGPKIKPLFKAYVYDEQTKSYGADLERGASRYDIGVPNKESLTLTISLDKTASYNDPDTLIYVLVKLYDSETGEYITETLKNMKISF